MFTQCFCEFVALVDCQTFVLHLGAQAIDLFDSQSFMARGVPGWFLIPLGVICHTHIACNMRLRQRFQTAFLILLPFLHSPASKVSIARRRLQSELRPHRMSVAGHEPSFWQSCSMSAVTNSGLWSGGMAARYRSG